MPGGPECGDGALRRVLEDARRAEACGRNELTVLSPQVDPYRLDTPAGQSPDPRSSILAALQRNILTPGSTR